MSGDILLEIDDLTVSFGRGAARRAALDGVTLAVRRGRTLGVVGESGCGKSLTALTVMQLLPRLQANVDGGRVIWHSGERPVDILTLKPSGRAMRALRGRQIAMIFQEPMTALDPVYTIGEQIAEMVMEHDRVSRRAALVRAEELLRLVGVPSPAARLTQYPHEFSGGMRQRAVIAIALACNPALLIADEPTTALDVTIQAQVLALMKDLQNRLGSSVLFITHDMGVIAQMADDVVVMYLGQIVERGPAARVVRAPAHPYTQGLIASIPTLDMAPGTRIEPIRGVVPRIGSVTSGCRFRSRCPHAMPVCETDPPMLPAGEGQDAACWLLEGRA